MTARDEENIIFALNTLSKEELSESGVLPEVLVHELYTHRSQHGPFLSLGDVLSLHGMTNDVFKKICSTFQLRHKESRFTIQDPSYLKYFSPSLSSETMESIQTVANIEVCLDSVCFASATRNLGVTSWNHVPLKGSNHNKQTPDMILEQALHVLPHLPKADIYIAETRIYRKHTLQHLPIHLFIARLQTAIQTLLSSHYLEKNGKHSFYFVKDYFLTRMFELRVGGERVSGQQLVQDIEDGKFLSQVDIEQNLWRRFHKLHTGVQKERYANCLLTSLAFISYIGPGQSQTS